MIIPLETFRSVFMICIGLIILRFIDGLFFDLPFSSYYLVFPFIILWAYLVVATISNFKSRALKFYWKKEQKTLFLPFGSRMIAHDDQGNTYKLDLFFTPKLQK